MRREQLKNIAHHVADGEKTTKCVSNQLRQECTTLGDIVWVKIRAGSWWPAQVVDRRCKNHSNNTNNILKVKIQVRLYGSCQFMHVDPTKYRFEFEKVLKEHNWNLTEILNKTLEQDLSQVKSSVNRKRKASAPKESALAELFTFKRSKQDKVQRNQKVVHSHEMGTSRKGSSSKNADAADLKTPKQRIKKNLNAECNGFETSQLKDVQELSARRMKVMQSLGLIAPCGSPFHRNGVLKTVMREL